MHTHLITMPNMLLIVNFFYHLTLYILSQFEFIFSLENDVMAMLKSCVFLLIFILKLLSIVVIIFVKLWLCLLTAAQIYDICNTLNLHCQNDTTP